LLEQTLTSPETQMKSPKAGIACFFALSISFDQIALLIDGRKKRAIKLIQKRYRLNLLSTMDWLRPSQIIWIAGKELRANLALFKETGVKSAYLRCCGASVR
jgi:hypothetical protein